MSQHEKIDYVELPARDLSATKLFFSRVFDWSFVDYGTDYCAFFNAGLNGGFFQSEQVANTQQGSALIVFYSKSLQQTRQKVLDAGGTITKPVFLFPGGHRFHFSDPNGNEYAVWSDTNHSSSAE